MECDFGAIEFFCAPSYLPNGMKQSEHLLENAGNCAQLAERATDQPTHLRLLKDVWQYKFVPETNLVNVHMGRLRRKVDGSNERPMIRSVRGVGLVLSATPFPQSSPKRTQG